MKYTDKQLLDRVKSLPSFKRTSGIPLLIGVQSKEDKFDEFDDKFYLFDDKDIFVIATSGTTNAGATGLKDFIKWNPKGVWVWKTDMFYPSLYKHGLHQGKMNALRQDKAVYGYRDGDRDDKNEQQGTLYFDNVSANFHGVDYDPNSVKIAKKIGGWSVACQVCNNMIDYKKIIKFVQPFVYCDYAILKEF